MVQKDLPPLPDGGPLTGSEFLERLVTILEGAFANEWDGPHRLVRVDDADNEGFQIGLLELDGHPAETLADLDAPSSWTVLGIIAFGWGTHLYRRGSRQRVRTIVLVDRSGAIASTARLRDGTTIDEAPVGLLPDMLRQALGVPLVSKRKA